MPLTPTAQQIRGRRTTDSIGKYSAPDSVHGIARTAHTTAVRRVPPWYRSANSQPQTARRSAPHRKTPKPVDPAMNMNRLRFSQAIVTAALIALATPLRAQRTVPAAIDRGSMIVDGSASISRSRSTAESDGTEAKATSTQVSLLPSLLYFVAPRFAVGGSLELSRFKNDAVTSTAVGAGPSARLYFAGQSATALPYVGTSVRVSRVSVDIDGSSSPPSTTQLGLEGVAGITFLFSRQVGIVTEAFVRRQSYSNSVSGNLPATDVTTTDLGLRVGVAAFIPRSR